MGKGSIEYKERLLFSEKKWELKDIEIVGERFWLCVWFSFWGYCDCELFCFTLV